MPPRLTNATTVSCSWANSVIRSGLRSPFRSDRDAHGSRRCACRSDAARMKAWPVVDGLVLQDGEVAGAAPAERRDRQIEPAVPVEIRGLDVRHPRPPPERGRDVGPVLAPAQPMDRAAVVVGRQRTGRGRRPGSRARRHRRDRRARCARDSTAAPFPRTPAAGARVHRIDDPAAHVAHDNLEPPVPIGIDQPKVCDRRTGRRRAPQSPAARRARCDRGQASRPGRDAARGACAS